MVYRIAVSNAKNRVDAEDIFQDVFISLMKHINKIENETHLKYWLIRTTINSSKKFHLCFWKKRVRLQDSQLDEAYVNNETIIDDEISVLRDEIKKLPEKQKSVIYLYYYEGYSIKEISIILKIAEGTVKSRLSSARKNLKTNLERG